jgi:hypothetical protein
MGADGMPSSAGILADGLQRDNPPRGNSPRDNPLRGGMLHVEELPLADSRTAAYQMIREAGPVVRDAHGRSSSLPGPGSSVNTRVTSDAE